MMPMFLHRSKGTVLDTAFFLSSFLNSCSLEVLVPVLNTSPSIAIWSLSNRGIEQLKNLRTASHYPITSQSLNRRLLPAIVRKRLVGFGHAVHIFLLLDRGTT